MKYWVKGLRCRPELFGWRIISCNSCAFVIVSCGGNWRSFICPIVAIASSWFLSAGAEHPPDALTKVWAM
jgi:hypothetical protein